jgi:hypothetical protein
MHYADFIFTIAVGMGINLIGGTMGGPARMGDTYVACGKRRFYQKLFELFNLSLSFTNMDLVVAYYADTGRIVSSVF